MSTKETSSPAFPAHHFDLAENEHGMTLRDYMAAKALPSVYSDYVAAARELGFDEGWQMGVAIDAYKMADAMLRAREVA